MASKAPIISRYAPRHAQRRRHRADRRQAAHGPHLEALLTVLPSLPRPTLARLVQKAIDRMDQMDGDADLEIGTDAEDDFAFSRHAVLYAGQVLGCAISEPDCGSYTEWHTREPWIQYRDGPEMPTTSQPQDHEDAEDDDPAGQCDEDELNTFPQALLYMEKGPGCPISDTGGGNVEDAGQINEVPPYTGPLDPSSPWPPRCA